MAILKAFAKRCRGHFDTLTASYKIRFKEGFARIFEVKVLL